jgi:ABC-type multidrug transport system ATPase subunit
MNQHILTAEHIQKRYGHRTVLRDISKNVRQGDIYGLVGKNGSGKTTLFRILTGLIQSYDGKVSISQINGRPSKISAVIGAPSLFLNMSAVQNMKAQAHLLGMSDNKKIMQILRTVGLEDCGKKVVRDFSLGMTQRLKLAMALLGEPDILVLDEPSNGLDPDGIVELRELLLDLSRSNGVTLLISSHILNEMEQLATCIGILHNGEIVKEQSMHDILQNGMSLEKFYMQYTKGGENCA